MIVTAKSVRNKVFPPNTEIVVVYTNNRIGFYNVLKPVPYLKKCEEDGKRCAYVGRSNEKGFIEIEKDIVL